MPVSREHEGRRRLLSNRGLYILDESGEKPVRCDDIEEWARWFERNFKLRQVEATLLDGGNILVSTVFLGVDHGLSGHHPVLWETMVFWIMDRALSGSLDYNRCSGTREQALALHDNMVERVEAVLALDNGIPLEV